jgi:predicted AAA+ superfamily ATPase
VLEINPDLKKNYVSNLKNSILLKDVVARYQIREYSYFEKTLTFLSQNVGNITSLRKIEDYFKKDAIKISLATLSNYCKYLENVFLLRSCQKFDLNGKRVLEHNGKYYFNDLGIRNSIYYNFRFDIGKILENYAYNALIREGYLVYF